MYSRSAALTDILQTAIAIVCSFRTGLPRGLQRNMPGIDPALRIQNHDAFDQISQLADVAGPVMLLQQFQRLSG